MYIDIYSNILLIILIYIFYSKIQNKNKTLENMSNYSIEQILSIKNLSEISKNILDGDTIKLPLNLTVKGTLKTKNGLKLGMGTSQWQIKKNNENHLAIGYNEISENSFTLLTNGKTKIGGPILNSLKCNYIQANNINANKINNEYKFILSNDKLSINNDLNLNNKNNNINDLVIAEPVYFTLIKNTNKYKLARSYGDGFIFMNERASIHRQGGNNTPAQILFKKTLT